MKRSDEFNPYRYLNESVFSMTTKVLDPDRFTGNYQFQVYVRVLIRELRFILNFHNLQKSSMKIHKQFNYPSTCYQESKILTPLPFCFSVSLKGHRCSFQSPCKGCINQTGKNDLIRGKLVDFVSFDIINEGIEKRKSFFHIFVMTSQFQPVVSVYTRLPSDTHLSGLRTFQLSSDTPQVNFNIRSNVRELRVILLFGRTEGYC